MRQVAAALLYLTVAYDRFLLYKYSQLCPVCLIDCLVRGFVVFLAHVHSDRSYQWHDY